MIGRLDAAGIRRMLTATSSSNLDELEVFSSIDSTNTYLLKQPAPLPGRFRIAIADQQTAGRGRRSRTWQSPPESGLYLSLAYTFAQVLDNLPALTLTLGVAVVNALSETGVDNAALKWPNDIVVNGGKLGGILTEVRSREAGSGITVIAGIGINLEFQQPLDLGADVTTLQRAVDLKSIVAVPAERGQLAGLVVEHMMAAITRFERDGFGGFADAWRRLDWLCGKEITIVAADERITGQAAGVDEDGALLVDIDSRRQRVVSGSITEVGGTTTPR
jgi:BirA family biotin operon repressor/biotin-[acetyl-CoA-carboxylase] ligase